jgi:hypothetical protein
MSRLTVLCHVYNEEFLLEHWLLHHRRIFDHGVIIDYASTDRSAELVRSLTPGWELRPSRNACFGAQACDQEVMEVEREHEGWKLVLNVTELVFSKDLRARLDELERRRPDVLAVGLRSYVMVDRREDVGRALDRRALALQCHSGYLDVSLLGRRLRFAHRGTDGAYELGRHGTRLPWVEDPASRLLWFGWAPYAQVRTRKLQIQTRMPDSDKRAGWGWQHVVTPAELDRRFHEESRRAHDLLEDPEFRSTYERLEAAMSKEGSGA